MCQTLVFNAINTIATDIECNIRIDRLPLGRGTDLGQSVYPDIAFHISNYKINIRQRTPEIPFKIRPTVYFSSAPLVRFLSPL